MDKASAIALLGGTNAAAALAVGCTVQAVTQWPDPLPPRIADRVQAALWRMAEAKKDMPASQPGELDEAGA